eukprot:COSAG02_NODE_2556_length_8531_cov_13.481380_5_plen_164_part_00
MIHQNKIDSEDFTTQSISPVTSSAHKPDRYRRLKNFCTVIFPISTRRRAQGQTPHSIDWAHLNFTCAGACRTLTEPLPNPYRTLTITCLRVSMRISGRSIGPLPTLTSSRFMPNRPVLRKQVQIREHYIVWLCILKFGGVARTSRDPPFGKSTDKGVPFSCSP